MNIRNAGREQENDGNRRKQSDGSRNPGDVELQTGVWFFSEFSIENEPCQKCCCQDPDAQQMQDEHVRNSHDEEEPRVSAGYLPVSNSDPVRGQALSKIRK